jgi:hypothetical protein
MSRVFVHGLGAVSPAGWGVPALRASLEKGVPLPVQSLARPGWEKPLPIRLIPPPAVRPAFLAHPRLRRASPMTHYSLAAALEALGSDASLISSGAIRLGIVTATMTGGLSYSRRFYEEVMENPATASPMIFPETVFNSAASHLAAFLGANGTNYTLVGDPGVYLQALALAADWLEDGVADACLVIGAEESDWTAADALRLFHRQAIHASGAGALYVKTDRSPVELVEVAEESLGESKRPDTNRNGQPGKVLAPAKILGEALTASSAWQCVAGCDAIQNRQQKAATVTIDGQNGQAIGARFISP